MPAETKKESVSLPSGEGLTLLYRGMTVHLPAGDPRIAFVDFLLFRDLPPPLSRPAQPEPEPEPQPAVAPEVQVPAAWHEFWNALPEGARTMLATLCRQQLTTPELETVLGMGPGETRALTIAIGWSAKKAGFANPIQGIGTGRLRRRHYVAHDARELVLELERRWRKVQDALDEARQ